MSTLREYMARTGESPEQIAEKLSAHFGRPIKVGGVKMWTGRGTVPKAWAAALGIVDTTPRGATDQPARDPSLNGGDADAPGDAMGRDSELPPRPLGSSPTAPASVPDFARKRIAAAYSFVGTGLGAGLQNEGVTRVWDDSAEPIAQAWIAAADQSEFARKFVTLMTSGGPMGEVVMLHVTMLAGTLYCLGQFPEVGLFGQYRRYRPAVAPSPAARPDDNGAAPAAARDAMADPAGPATA